jgi:outer membrane protein
MKKILMSMLLLLGIGVEMKAQPMTLEEAIALGLENNFSIRIARNTAAIARNTATLGASVFLPTLDASASASLLDTRQESNSPFTFGDSETRALGAQLSLNWTLFDGFRMFAERNRYNQLALLGEEQARAAIEHSVLGIARAYFTLVQQQQLALVLQRSLDLSRLRLEKEQVRRGLGGSLTELLTAEVAYAGDSLQIMEQQLAIELARQDLNLALGRDPDEACDAVSVIDVPELRWSDDELRDRALRRNSELRIARTDLDIADQEAGIALSTFMPRVGLFATWGYSDRLVATMNGRFDYDIQTQSTDATIGLNVSMNLFQGFRNSTEVQNARLRIESRRLALEETEARVIADLRARLLTFRMRLDAARLAGNNLEAARRSLELHLERFNAGAISSLEFRDVQLQHVRAETAYISARFLARVALLEVQRSIGDISMD